MSHRFGMGGRGSPEGSPRPYQSGGSFAAALLDYFVHSPIHLPVYFIDMACSPTVMSILPV